MFLYCLFKYIEKRNKIYSIKSFEIKKTTQDEVFYTKNH